MTEKEILCNSMSCGRKLFFFFFSVCFQLELWGRVSFQNEQFQTLRHRRGAHETVTATVAPPTPLKQEPVLPVLCACFGSTYTKIGTIQRRLAWPLRKDDTQIREAFHIVVPGYLMQQLSQTTGVILSVTVFVRDRGIFSFVSESRSSGVVCLCIALREQHLGESSCLWDLGVMQPGAQAKQQGQFQM